MKKKKGSKWEFKGSGKPGAMKPKEKPAAALKKPGVKELKEKLLRPGAKPELPKAGPRKSNTMVYVAVVAVVLVVIIAVALITLNFLPPAPGPGQGPDENVPEKEMPSDREEALAGARDAEPEGIEIVEGAESVPSELINPLESEETEKFEDLSNLFKVIFELTDRGEVTFEEVSGLDEGRISITPAGDYSVQLLDAGGKILYELEFNAIFFIMGNPPEKIDSMKFVFVLPGKEGAAKVAVTKERRVLAEKEIA